MSISEAAHAVLARQDTRAVARRRPRWLARYVAAVGVLDLFAAVVAAVIAYVVRFPDAVSERVISNDAGLQQVAPHAASGYFWFSLILPLMWVAALAMARAYDDRALGLGSDEFARVGRAAVGLTAAVGFVSYATKAEVARGYVVLALPLAALLCVIGRYAVRRFVHAMRSDGRCMSDVVVVGGERAVIDLVVQLRREPFCGLRVVGACIPDDNAGDQLTEIGVPVLGGLSDVVSAVHDTDADTVAVTASGEIDPARLRRISWELERTETDLLVAPGLMEVAGPRLHIRPVTGLPLLHVEEPEFSGGRRMVKGAIDRMGAAFLLFVSLPLIVTIAVAIKLSDRGPVFFRQVRIGRDGKQFTMVKFRTMVVDAESRRGELVADNERAEGLLFKIRHDPRITSVGRILRKYSLDELPQLFNVLAGSMSLVGPRPPLPAEVAQYADDVRRRLLVKPGLTGLWQISGRSDLTWDESVRLDLRYVENWSLMFDLMILWKTFFAVLRGSGAY